MVQRPDGAHVDAAITAMWVDLMKYGEVIYWSGERDDAKLGRRALEHRRGAAHIAAAH
jgi:hypothetical protein